MRDLPTSATASDSRRHAAAVAALTLLAAICVVTTAPSAVAAAVPCGTPTSVSDVPIITYDVQDTPPSGFGGWGHTYSRPATDTGRTFNSGIGSPDVPLLNYTGGSGTLNDGAVANLDATQLFVLRSTTPAGTTRPQVTLHLGGSFVIDKIHLCGGEVELNIFPGDITGMTVAVGGLAQPFSTVPFGAPNVINVPRNDTVDLTTTALSRTPTDTVVLSDFTSAFDQFPITEIMLEGRSSTTPVTIDIKPGQARNVVELSELDPIQVAVVSSRGFRAATEIDRASVTFGRTGAERSIVGCKAKDANKDGLSDLVCEASTARAGFRLGDTQGRLRGKTTAGTAITGTDLVTVKR